MVDRLVLEIVAEGEIPEHFEEGVVARGVADIVEVVVLAAGADAFLAAGRGRIGPRLEAGEDVLERHHAGVDEHQRRVVVRHQRRRRHARMARPSRNSRGSCGGCRWSRSCVQIWDLLHCGKQRRWSDRTAHGSDVSHDDRRSVERAAAQRGRCRPIRSSWDFLDAANATRRCSTGCLHMRGDFVQATVTKSKAGHGTRLRSRACGLPLKLGNLGPLDADADASGCWRVLPGSDGRGRTVAGRSRDPWSSELTAYGDGAHFKPHLRHSDRRRTATRWARARAKIG